MAWKSMIHESLSAFMTGLIAFLSSIPEVVWAGIISSVLTLSGVLITAVAHSAAGFLISVFLIIHLYVASIGKNPAENFKSIINGWHNIH